jgi:hypothetical protein
LLAEARPLSASQTRKDIWTRCSQGHRNSERPRLGDQFIQLAPRSCRSAPGRGGHDEHVHHSGPYLPSRLELPHRRRGCARGGGARLLHQGPGAARTRLERLLWRLQCRRCHRAQSDGRPDSFPLGRGRRLPGGRGRQLPACALRRASGRQLARRSVVGARRSSRLAGCGRPTPPASPTAFRRPLRLPCSD